MAFELRWWQLSNFLFHAEGPDVKKKILPSLSLQGCAHNKSDAEKSETKKQNSISHHFPTETHCGTAVTVTDASGADLSRAQGRAQLSLLMAAVLVTAANHVSRLSDTNRTQPTTRLVVTQWVLLD